MQDSQETPAEQQTTVSQEGVSSADQQDTTTQAAATAQATHHPGPQQMPAVMPSSPEARIAEIAAQLAHTRISELQGQISQLEAQVAQGAQLQTQLEQARKETEQYRNQYIRVQADVENIRKRQEKQLADRLLQLKKSLFKQILEVMDNVERALVYQETMDKQDLQQTLRMLQWQMGEVLRGEGLNPVPTVGETFNPYIHEAVEAVEESDQPDGTILAELRKGYTLGDETLRPARVKVSVGK